MKAAGYTQHSDGRVCGGMKLGKRHEKVPGIKGAGSNGSLVLSVGRGEFLFSFDE